MLASRRCLPRRSPYCLFHIGTIDRTWIRYLITRLKTFSSWTHGQHRFPPGMEVVHNSTEDETGEENDSADTMNLLMI